MIFNVSGLLNSSVGREIKVDFTQTRLQYHELTFHQVGAHGKLMRTDRTVLAEAYITANCQTSCSRCLEPADTYIEIDFAEEFIPSNPDLVVRRPIPIYHEEEQDQALTIPESNVLDMSEALGQSLTSAIPMRPLCRPGCKGFCTGCWQNLNTAHCKCPSRTNEPDSESLAFSATDSLN